MQANFYSQFATNVHANESINGISFLSILWKSRFCNSLNACNIYNVPLGCHNDTKLGLGSYQEYLQVPNRRWSSCFLHVYVSEISIVQPIDEAQRTVPKENHFHDSIGMWNTISSFLRSSVPSMVYEAWNECIVYSTEHVSPAVQHWYTVCCFVDSSGGVYENTTYKLDVLQWKKTGKITA